MSLFLLDLNWNIIIFKAHWISWPPLSDNLTLWGKQPATSPPRSPCCARPSTPPAAPCCWSKDWGRSTSALHASSPPSMWCLWLMIKLVPLIGILSNSCSHIFFHPSWWKQQCHLWSRPQPAQHALQMELRISALDWCSDGTWASFEPLPVGLGKRLHLRQGRWTFVFSISVLIIPGVMKTN